MTRSRTSLLIATSEHQRVMDLVVRDATEDPDNCSVETVAAERFDDVPWHDRVCLISPSGVVALPVVGDWPLMGASGPEAVRALAEIMSTSPRDTNTHAFTWSSNAAFSDSCRRIAEDATRETSMQRMGDLDEVVDRDGLKGGDLVCEVGMSDEGDPIVRVDTPMEMARLTITDDLRSRIVSEEPMFLMDNLALDVVAADLGPVDVAFHPILNDESGFVLTVPRLGPMDILRSLSGDQQ